MPLLDLQKALGTLVSARAATGQVSAESLSSFNALNLTDAERQWLGSLIDTTGFRVTCDIQRWWRETKLKWTARLTLAALGAERSQQAIKEYLQVSPCASLFFVPEAIGFLNFIERTVDGIPHVASIARFESALLLAREEAAHVANGSSDDSDNHALPHAAAVILAFAASPIELISAALKGQKLPPVSQEIFYVLISPSLPHLWRPATIDEAKLFSVQQAKSASPANMV